MNTLFKTVRHDLVILHSLQRAPKPFRRHPGRVLRKGFQFFRIPHKRVQQCIQRFHLLPVVKSAADIQQRPGSSVLPRAPVFPAGRIPVGSLPLLRPVPPERPPRPRRTGTSSIFPGRSTDSEAPAVQLRPCHVPPPDTGRTAPACNTGSFGYTIILRRRKLLPVLYASTSRVL